MRELWIGHLQRRMLLAVFCVAGVLGCVLALAWLLLCILFSPSSPRAMHIVLAFDQLVNAATGGDMDETISSRAGRLRGEGRGWACVLCWALDWLERDHCKNSIGT